jgi:hypothetical protein
MPFSSRAAEVSWVKEDRPKIRMLDFPRWIVLGNEQDD